MMLDLMFMCSAPPIPSSLFRLGGFNQIEKEVLSPLSLIICSASSFNLTNTQHLACAAAATWQYLSLLRRVLVMKRRHNVLRRSNDLFAYCLQPYRCRFCCIPVFLGKCILKSAYTKISFVCFRSMQIEHWNYEHRWTCVYIYISMSIPARWG